MEEFHGTRQRGVVLPTDAGVPDERGQAPPGPR